MPKFDRGALSPGTGCGPGCQFRASRRRGAL